MDGLKTSYSKSKDLALKSLPVTNRKVLSASSRSKIQPINRTKSKSERKSAQLAKTKINATEENGDENEIKFINIESSVRREVSSASRSTKLIKADEILERCQETDYRNVYNIDLRGSGLLEVPNLEKFSKVRVIDLSSNYIQVISRLECCGELRELKLYDNKLTAIEKLDALSDLSNLQLQHNKISSIDRGLVSCRKLLSLRLDCNNLLRLESRELAAMSKLTTLDLSNNKLDNINAVNTLPNLEDLFACNNRLRTIELSRCKKLKELDVSGNRLTDLNCLCANAASLTTVNLSRNAINKLELATPLHNLEELYISHNTIKRLSHVPTKLPVIQVLDLSDNHIRNDKELLTLQHCDFLRELDLTNNPFELDDLGQISTNPAEIVPSLQILDGMVIKKLTTASKIPLMRPMSASHVISSRQVQSHLDSLDAEMKTLQTNMEEMFRKFRTDIDQLPSRSSSRAKDSERPPTRGSRRSRISEAKAFAIHRYAGT